VPLEHTLSLYEAYAGEKSLNVCEGLHNSARQRHIIDKIGKFFAKYLKSDEEKKEEEIIQLNTTNAPEESNENEKLIDL
jgi:hypothetical protein